MHHSSAVTEIVAGIIILLLIAATILALTKRLRLPHSVILVLIGIGLAAMSEHNGEAFPLLKQLALSPDLILYVFLPILILSLHSTWIAASYATISPPSPPWRFPASCSPLP